jgi:hypothetical protein
MKTKCFAGGWKVYREAQHGWFLVDPAGYERFTGKNWLESIPVINLILDNHGESFRVS